jgi:hypothetical protein
VTALRITKKFLPAMAHEQHRNDDAHHTENIGRTLLATCTRFAHEVLVCPGPACCKQKSTGWKRGKQQADFETFTVPSGCKTPSRLTPHAEGATRGGMIKLTRFPSQRQRYGVVQLRIGWKPDSSSSPTDPRFPTSQA